MSDLVLTLTALFIIWTVMVYHAYCSLDVILEDNWPMYSQEADKVYRSIGDTLILFVLLVIIVLIDIAPY